MKKYKLEGEEKELSAVQAGYINSEGIDVKQVKCFSMYVPFEIDKKAKEEDEDEFDGIKISGFLSTFGNADRGNDVVHEAAFDKTIKDIQKRGGKIPMLRDHYAQTDHQIGMWDQFAITKKGLQVSGRISRTSLTEHIIKLIQDGAINTLSMGGFFKYAEEKDEKGRNIIEQVMLLEGSVVTIPANPQAEFSMKSLVDVTNESQVAQAKSEQVEKTADQVRVEKINDLKIKLQGVK